jgi:hypothetical protein
MWEDDRLSVKLAKLSKEANLQLGQAAKAIVAVVGVALICVPALSPARGDGRGDTGTILVGGRSRAWIAQRARGGSRQGRLTYACCAATPA